MSKDLEINRKRYQKIREPKSMNSIIERHLKVFFLFQEKPYTLKEIKEKTKIPKSTIYEIKDRLLHLKVIKYLEKNKFVDINYYPLEEEVENWLKLHYKEKFPPAAISRKMIDIIAIKIKKTNDEEFSNAFERICKRYGVSIV